MRVVRVVQRKKEMSKRRNDRCTLTSDFVAQNCVALIRDCQAKTRRMYCQPNLQPTVEIFSSSKLSIVERCRASPDSSTVAPSRGKRGSKHATVFERCEGSGVLPEEDPSCKPKWQSAVLAVSREMLPTWSSAIAPKKVSGFPALWDLTPLFELGKSGLARKTITTELIRVLNRLSKTRKPRLPRYRI